MTAAELADRVMRARKESQCPACHRWIHPGNLIARCPGRVWRCIECAIAHQHDNRTEDNEP